MKIKFTAIILTVWICLFLLTGCVFISSDFRCTSNMIINELAPLDVDTEVQLQIGPGLLCLSGLVAGFTNVGNEALSYIQDIKNVQVGVYKLRGVDKNRPVSISNKIAEQMLSKGYELMVKVKQRDEAVWVMTRLHTKQLVSMYVITLERSELVLVEIRGRLDQLIVKAIREHGFRSDDFMNM